MEPDQLKREFRAAFGVEPQLFRAPGRVNLIGEHTDYNDGFVMPAAIDFYTTVAIAPRTDKQLNIRSDGFSGRLTVDLSNGVAPRRDWSDYVVGVFQQVRERMGDVDGADILIHGEVPIGAGLSSSAAIEVATAFALLHQVHGALDRKQIALLCQRAENQFVGMRCGIMDQFISCNGQRDHALMLDCRSLEFSLLPLSPKVRLVIANSMVKHQLASGEYNERRAACEEGVRLLKNVLSEITALRDVSSEQLETYRDLLPEIIYRRCRHVVTENERVQRAAAMLSTGDLAGFGKLMAQSHASLRDDYQVSCRELDVLVGIAQKQPGVYGARMTGGGFGGCTINLVQAEQAEAFRRKLAQVYQQAIGLQPEIYISSAADGAAQVG